MKHNPGHLGGYLHPRSAATRALVNCAFCFCWDAWFHDHPALHQTATPRPQPGRGERRAARRPAAVGTVLAPGNPGGASLAFPWVTLQRWWPTWSNAPPLPPCRPRSTRSRQAAACTSTSILTNYR